MRRLLALMVGFHLLVANSAAVPLGLFIAGDQHSSYQAIPDWLYTLSVTWKQFKQEHPKGVFLLVIPGDFTGANSGTTVFPPGTPLKSDHGRLGYDVLAHLGNMLDIVLVPGNHDQFDWEDNGADLFIEHHSELAHVINENRESPHRLGQFTTLAANIVPGQDGKGLFAPFSDFQLGEKRVRFVGGVLDVFYDKSNCKRNGTLIQDVRSMADVAIEQLDQAVKSGVTDLIFVVHEAIEGETGLKAVAKSLKEYMRKNPKGLDYSKVRLPLFVGAHDHQQKTVYEDGIHFIQSGSNFSSTFVVLNGRLGIERIAPYSLLDQQKIASSARGNSSFQFPAFFGLAEESVRRRLDEIREGSMPRRLTDLPAPFLATKHDFTQGINPYGQLLADVLAEYGASTKEPLGSSNHILANVAFLRSSVNRLEQTIPAGVFTTEHILKIYPFMDRAASFIVTGRELELLFGAAREAEKARGKYSPQLSSNLREVPDTGPDYKLEVLNETSGWQRVELSGQYRLTVDPFQGRNMAGLPMWQRILGLKPGDKRHTTGHLYMSEILERYAPSIAAGCAAILSQNGDGSLSFEASDGKSGGSSQPPSPK